MNDRQLVVIIGAQKSGTSTLYEWLRAQHGIVPSIEKELHYFDFHYQKGKEYYLSRFENREGALLLEASPMYLFHPHVPKRMHAQFSDAKLIVLLRNPVDRAWSQYRMNVRRGIEKLGFQAALRFEKLRMLASSADVPESRFQNYSYAQRGLYSLQISRWLRYFSRNQLFIAVYEHFFANPNQGLDNLEKFLCIKLSDREITKYSYNTGEGYIISDELRIKISSIFAKEVQKLKHLITPDFGDFESWRIS
ncbi:MAG: sulfotransferase domain-containing protein [Thermaurantimonas sp.]|uniref:sulfotransferase domain-containing protein n=1 Tax=Thermaurantimonas sp. TaxID=2681568 RepID=UPI00391D807F